MLLVSGKPQHILKSSLLTFCDCICVLKQFCFHLLFSQDFQVQESEVFPVYIYMFFSKARKRAQLLWLPVNS